MPERKKRTVYRDSRDGQFITKREAERRPATTEKQHMAGPPPKRSRKRK